MYNVEPKIKILPANKQGTPSLDRGPEIRIFQ